MYITYKNYNTFLNKTILAIDFGTKQAGLATYRPGRDPYPTPFKQIKYISDERLVEEIICVIDEEFVEVVVLGLPHYLDGNESKMTLRVREFAAGLSLKIAGCQFFLQDETLTSVEAEARMKESPQYNFKVNKEKLDAFAAAIILEDFIRAGRLVKFSI